MPKEEEDEVEALLTEELSAKFIYLFSSVSTVRLLFRLQIFIRTCFLLCHDLERPARLDVTASAYHTTSHRITSPVGVSLRILGQRRARA